MSEKTVSILSQKFREIALLNEWTETTFKEIIFDSDICDWNQCTSTFHQRIFNREQLVFIIEDEEGNVFGCFINAKIDKYKWKENGHWFEKS